MRDFLIHWAAYTMVAAILLVIGLAAVKFIPHMVAYWFEALMVLFGLGATAILAAVSCCIADDDP